MSYTTVENLKKYLGISPSITDDDDLLGDVIDYAVNEIDSIVGFSFAAESDTTRRFTYGEHVNIGNTWQERRTLYFDTWLADEPTTVTNGDGNVIDPSNYVLIPTNRFPAYGLRLKRDSNVDWTYSTSPEEAISVLGRWAWSTSAPKDVERVALRLSAFLYRQKDAQTFDVTGFSELGEIKVSDSTLNDVAKTLNRYKWVTGV